MHKTLIPLVIAIGLSGCATPAPKQSLPPLQTAETFESPKFAVWPLVVEEISQQYPIKVIEKDSGLITTEFVSINAGFANNNAWRYVQPPGGFLATYDGLRVTLTAIVTEVETNKTRVNLKTHYEAFEDNVSHSWKVCESNGSLESAMLQKVRSRLRSR